MPGSGFNVDVEDLRERTRELASQVVLGLSEAKGGVAAPVIINKVIDAAGCTEMNFDYACRVRSKEAFFERLPKAVASANEAVYWLGLARRTGVLSSSMLEPLLQQASEIAAALRAAQRRQK